MKPSSVSKFLWAARDIDSVRTVTNSIYVCKCIPNLAIVGFWSWLVKDNKSKREEKNKHIYKKKP